MSKHEYTTPEVTELRRTAKSSIAQIVLHGLNRAVINHESDTTYKVVCGDGTMEVDFDVIDLKPGVSVTVPAGTPYQDEGCLKLLAESVPPFNIAAIEYLD
ncbi:MAG: hypothetical protein V4678_03835 [Patescibacteria group bacterium]